MFFDLFSRGILTSGQTANTVWDFINSKKK